MEFNMENMSCEMALDEGAEYLNGEDKSDLYQQLKDLKSENEELLKSGVRCPIALRLIEEEMNRLQGKPKEPPKFLDVIRDRPTKVSVKVGVPAREHPKFNFVGKLLGPKGNSLKRLQEETLTRMAVLGKGSMRDRAKEEELRAANEPRYQHLNLDLHVDISATAPPAEAYARLAYALVEIRRYLVPDNNDEISQEQMREMQIIAGVGTEPGLRGGRGARGTLLVPHAARVIPPKTRVLSILDRARDALGDPPVPYDPYSYAGYADGYDAADPSSRIAYKLSPMERTRFRATPY